MSHVEHLIDNWQEFCEAMNIPLVSYFNGVKLLTADPDAWEGASMWELWEASK